jgi:hypothetical protein
VLTLTPLENAVASLLPTAYSRRRKGTNRRANQMMSGTPIVMMAPGKAPMVDARCRTHPVLCTDAGFGAMSRSTPCRPKNIASVTTIGWTRSRTMRTPLIMPTPRPMPRMIGTEIAPPSPCGISQTTNTQFVRMISGEIDRSKPPPMIAGALARAAIAIGATLASWLLQPKPPCTVAMLVISSAAASKAAKPKL